MASLRRLWRRMRRRFERPRVPRPSSPAEPQPVGRPATWLGVILLALLLAALAVGAWKLTHFLRGVPAAEWGTLGGAAAWTLGRVLVATALGTLWALPAVIAIGLSPRLPRRLPPGVQICASFP